MKLTRIKSLSNTWHFYAILVVLIGLTLTSLYFLPVLVIYLIYLYKIRFINKGIIILGLYFIVAILFLSLYNKVSDKTNITGIVLSVTEHDDYCSMVVLRGLKKIRVISGLKIIPSVGDKVALEGKYKALSLDSFSMYLKGNAIYSSFSVTKLEIKGRSIFSVKGFIISFYSKYLDAKSFSYFKSLILGINDFEDEYKKAINSIGISYLFCISGFHISMIVAIFDKILEKIFPLSYKRNYALIIILFLYGALTNFSYGVLRAILMYTFKKINDYKRLGMSRLDICSSSFLLITIINPMALYSMSLRLSYIIMLMIVLSEDLLKNKTKLLRDYLMALISFLVTIPLVISMNNQINLISLIISPIFLSIFSLFILPLSYILVILPFLSPMISSVYILFEKLIYLIDSIELLKITIRSLKGYEVIIYYSLFYLMLRHFEIKGVSYFKLLSLILSIMLIVGLDYLTIYDQIVMLDVGQGDSILFKKNHNQGNILIDSYNNISNLKALGVKKIDTLIITHSDNDHYETALDVISRYNVKTVITSAYDTQANEDLASLSIKHIKASAGDSYRALDVSFEFLGPVSASNTLNNNSLVFMMDVNQTKLLFTGDMEEEEEESLNIPGSLSFDILKVPHHGSSTSLSSSFFNKLSFKDAIISVGANNKFGHPTEETLNKLKRYHCYRTDLDGQIYISIYKSGYKIKQNLDYSFLKMLNKVL